MTVDHVTFANSFGAARDAFDHIRDATSDFCSVKGTRYYLTDDYESGFAIRKDGELVFVFSTVKGRGNALVRAAVRRGATHLDCFDGYLPTLYGRHGFVETRREPNWTPDGPDVVWMAQS